AVTVTPAEPDPVAVDRRDEVGAAGQLGGPAQLEGLGVEASRHPVADVDDDAAHQVEGAAGVDGGFSVVGFEAGLIDGSAARQVQGGEAALTGGSGEGTVGRRGDHDEVAGDRGRDPRLDPVDGPQLLAAAGVERDQRVDPLVAGLDVDVGDAVGGVAPDRPGAFVEHGGPDDRVVDHVEGRFVRGGVDLVAEGDAHRLLLQDVDVDERVVPGHDDVEGALVEQARVGDAGRGAERPGRVER